MELVGTPHLSSGSYPSQSTKNWRPRPRYLSARSFWTVNWASVNQSGGLLDRRDQGAWGKWTDEPWSELPCFNLEGEVLGRQPHSLPWSVTRCIAPPAIRHHLHAVRASL